MSLVAEVDLLIRAGDTFSKVFRYGAGPVVYKAITAISKTAPVAITAPNHGLVDGWPVAITNVLGMTEINAEANALKAKDFRRATVQSADVITLNAVDAGGFSTYKSGGTLQYPTPVDLSPFTAEMLIYVNGQRTATPLRFSSAGGDIVLDNVAKTILVSISSTLTGMFNWRGATYDLNLLRGPDVYSLAGGAILLDAGTGTPLDG